MHAIKLEKFLELLSERIARLGENAHESLPIQRVHRRDHGQSPNELRDEPELVQILRGRLGEQVVLIDDVAAVIDVEPDRTDPNTLVDDVLQPSECPRDDEENVRRVNLQEVLVRVLASTLGRHRGSRPLEDLQQGLLDALTRHITGDGGILGLAGDLVDLVNVDDSGFGAFDVEISGLDEFEENVLHVLTDIPGFRESCGVRHGEWHIEPARQGLGKIRLATSSRSQQQDVRLAQFDVVVLGTSGVGHLGGGVDALVVVVHRHGEGTFCSFLTNDVGVEEFAHFPWPRKILQGGRLGRLGKFLLDDLIAQVDALITDVHPGPGNEFLHEFLTLATEGALEQITALSQTRHAVSTHQDQMYSSRGTLKNTFYRSMNFSSRCGPDKNLELSVDETTAWGTQGGGQLRCPPPSARAQAITASQATPKISSMRPYSLASGAVRYLSRSTSLDTCSTLCPVASESMVSMRRRIRWISLSRISMSVA